jgi:hypothetical protein
MGFQPPQPMSKAASGGIEISWKNDDRGYGIFTGISSVARTITVSKGSSPF